MENRGNVKSGCQGVLLRDSVRNSGVRALGTASGRTGSAQTLELNSGCSEGASDACVFFPHVGCRCCSAPTEAVSILYTMAQACSSGQLL